MTLFLLKLLVFLMVILPTLAFFMAFRASERGGPKRLYIAIGLLCSAIGAGILGPLCWSVASAHTVERFLFLTVGSFICILVVAGIIALFAYSIIESIFR